MKRQITYVLGKDNQPVYNISFEELIKEYLGMSDKVQLLAADEGHVTPRKHTLIKDFANGDRSVRDFDITFTVGDNSDVVAAVRMNEDAARKFHKELGEKLDNNDVDT